MYQILKIVGVPADALPKLHAVLNKSEMRSDTRVWWYDDRCRIPSHPPFTELLSSKYNKERNTYTLEIKVVIKMGCTSMQEEKNVAQKNLVLFPPLSILVEIYKALDTDFFPEKQKTIETKELYTD